MELPVALQLRELELAVAAGLGLALAYDLLRPLRRGRVTTLLTDILWCGLVFAGLLAFALWAGRGRLRIFAAAASCLSCGLWLGLISPALRRLGHALLHFVRRGEKH